MIKYNESHQVPALITYKCLKCAEFPTLSSDVVAGMRSALVQCKCISFLSDESMYDPNNKPTTQRILEDVCHMWNAAMTEPNFTRLVLEGKIK